MRQWGRERRAHGQVVEHRPGEREARWIHLLGGEVLAVAQTAVRHPTDQHGPRPPARDDEIDALRRQVGDLHRRFDALLERNERRTA